MADYESVLCVKNEVFVYQIPARTSNRGYRAADWKLDEPDWSGRLKVIAKDRDLVLKLEDKNTGELFAQCPVEAYPSAVVEQVLDSSRYFVIRIQDGSGRHASIGLGFADRGDSFDLLVSLQDHFKHVKRDDTVKHDATTEGQATLDSAPKLDLSFKEGQTIKLNFVTKKSGDPTGVGKGRPKGQGGAPLMLPPPPGSGTKVIIPPTRPAPPPGVSPVHNQNQTVRSTPVAVAMTTVSSAPSQSNVDFLLDLGPSTSSASSSYSSSTTPHSTADASATDWDEFTGVVATKLTIKPPDVKKPDPNVLSWENFE